VLEFELMLKVFFADHGTAGGTGRGADRADR